MPHAMSLGFSGQIHRRISYEEVILKAAPAIVRWGHVQEIRAKPSKEFCKSSSKIIGKDNIGETHPNRQEEARPRPRARAPRPGVALRGCGSQPQSDPGGIRLGSGDPLALAHRPLLL